MFDFLIVIGSIIDVILSEINVSMIQPLLVSPFLSCASSPFLCGHSVFSLVLSPFCSFSSLTLKSKTAAATLGNPPNQQGFLNRSTLVSENLEATQAGLSFDRKGFQSRVLQPNSRPYCNCCWVQSFFVTPLFALEFDSITNWTNSLTKLFYWCFGLFYLQQQGCFFVVILLQHVLCCGCCCCCWHLCHMDKHDQSLLLSFCCPSLPDCPFSFLPFKIVDSFPSSY